MYSRVKLQLYIIYTVVRELIQSPQTFLFASHVSIGLQRRQTEESLHVQSDARHDQTSGRASATRGDRGTSKVPDRIPSQEGV